MDRVAAIVVGAGSAERMGTDKIFVGLAGKPCITWSLDVLQGCQAINEIILVLHKDKVEAGKKMVAENGLTKVSVICEGGRLRQDSVKKGLEQVQGCQWVLVQDGARPFLTDKLINDGIEAARQNVVDENILFGQFERKRLDQANDSRPQTARHHQAENRLLDR